MADHDKDIEALLGTLTAFGLWGGDAGERARRQHAALTALVAERDRLKNRVAKLEADQTPSESDIIQLTMMNREAELRLTCSALTGIYAHLNCADDPVRNGKSAAAAAKAALDALAALRPREWSTSDPARDLCGGSDCDLDGEKIVAMRKGESDGK